MSEPLDPDDFAHDDEQRHFAGVDPEEEHSAEVAVESTELELSGGETVQVSYPAATAGGPFKPGVSYADSIPDQPGTDAEPVDPVGPLGGLLQVNVALPRALLHVVKNLEPLDLETAIKEIEDEPLPGDPDLRPMAVRNRADRAELLRAFLALRETGRGIARRLEDDEAGRPRDE